MTRALALLLVLWLGLNGAAAFLAAYFGSRALADLGPTHDPADCEVCQWVDDIGVVWAIDWSLWAAEMQERAS